MSFFPHTERNYFRQTLPRIGLYSLLLLVVACGTDVEDPYPPSAPHWVEKTAVEVWPERGIDAEPGGIFLEWEPNPEPDVTAYLIYRAEYNDTLPELEFELLYTVDQQTQGALTSYLDETAAVDVRYYYFLRARDTGDNLSPPSDTLFYQRLPAVDPASMFPRTFEDTISLMPRFEWNYGYHTAMEDYVITILRYNDESLVERVWFQPGDYTGGREHWDFHPHWEVRDGDSVWVTLEPGTRYQWRIEQNAQYDGNREHAGAESAWAYFVTEEE